MVYLTKQVDVAVAEAQQNSWFLLESCLLVAEGVLKRGINFSFELIRASTGNDHRPRGL